jgi:hypothetical protein
VLLFAFTYLHPHPLYTAPPANTVDYVIAIPTYHRAQAFGDWTYKMLKDASLLHMVVLFLQCPEDVRDYGEAYPDLKVVESPQGLLETANFISQHFPAGTNIVQLHDDVKHIVKFVSKAQSEEVDDVDAVFTEAFRLMQAHRLGLGGMFPYNNTFHKPKHAVTTDLSFVHDPVTFIHLYGDRSPVVLQKQFEQKQDYHRSIEFYKRDDGVLRLNHYAFEHQGYNKSNLKGGVADTMSRTLEDDKVATEVFVRDYALYIDVYKSDSKKTGKKKGDFKINYNKAGFSSPQLRDRTDEASSTTPTPVPAPTLAPPPHLRRYNIHDNPLRFSAGKLYHQTGTFTGLRVFVSAFNYDHNFDGQSYCTHSASLRGQPPQPPQHLDGAFGGPKYDALKNWMRRKYRSIALTGQNPPASKFRTAVRGASFGLGKSRASQAELAANGVFTKQVLAKGNTKYPVLFKAIKDALAESFGDDFFGTTSKHRYRSLYLSVNATSYKHIDPNNLGDSVVVAMGDFTDGELEVYVEGGEVEEEQVEEQQQQQEEQGVEEGGGGDDSDD